MNFEAIVENLPLYLSGAWTTLQLLLISLSLGLLLAIPLAVLRSLPSPWISRPIWFYTYVFRGTPMLVQLFLIYYGLAQFEWVRESLLWPWFSSAWFCVCLAFVLNTCAYTVEIIAGAIRALPHGEIEAAKSLGMSRWVMLRRIVLPSALRRALPAYSNEAIFMLHGTALASIVTLMDLTGAARQVNATYYIPFEAFITAAVFYFLMTLVLVGLFHKAEARWLKPLMPR
ncbi:MAG: amino acid ABC transporter permease [Methylibium sp.]|jgi:arginine/ornithine transport system permease protein|uniref:ABC transporter permease n=1 Tax=Roseateles sp. TaxID=1971397 RepID=UPI0037CA0A82|nr:amino acid ABC transporter permease [Methylibium sp.]